jgi:hypothetical protein
MGSTRGRVRRHEAGVASPAESELAELCTSPLKCPTPKHAATPSSAAPSSRWPTRPSWSYTPRGPRGRRAGGCGAQACAVSARPDALRGRCSSPLASSGDGDAPSPADGDGVPMASAGMGGMRGGAARVLARRSAQGDGRSPRPSDRRAVDGGVSCVEAHAPAGDGGSRRRAEACGPRQSMGTSAHRSVRRAGGGSPALRARASRGAPR